MYYCKIRVSFHLPCEDCSWDTKSASTLSHMRVLHRSTAEVQQHWLCVPLWQIYSEGITYLISVLRRTENSAIGASQRASEIATKVTAKIKHLQLMWLVVNSLVMAVSISGKRRICKLGRAYYWDRGSSMTLCEPGPDLQLISISAALAVFCGVGLYRLLYFISVGEPTKTWRFLEELSLCWYISNL